MPRLPGLPKSGQALLQVSELHGVKALIHIYIFANAIFIIIVHEFSCKQNSLIVTFLLYYNINT